MSIEIDAIDQILSHEEKQADIIERLTDVVADQNMRIRRLEAHLPMLERLYVEQRDGDIHE